MEYSESEVVALRQIRSGFAHSMLDSGRDEIIFDSTAYERVVDNMRTFPTRRYSKQKHETLTGIPGSMTYHRFLSLLHAKAVFHRGYEALDYTRLGSASFSGLIVFRPDPIKGVCYCQAIRTPFPRVIQRGVACIVSFGLRNSTWPVLSRLCRSVGQCFHTLSGSCLFFGLRLRGWRSNRLRG